MSKRVKWSIIGVATLGLATCVGITAAKRAGRATAVRMEQVQRRDLVASVTASGQVRPRTKVDVSADVTGRIVRLAVREGQMVSKGQFLLQIDPAQAEAAVQRAQASLAAARAAAAQNRANFLQAERNYQRSLEIRKANAALVSDEQLEQLRTALEVNRALLESAGHQVEQAVASVRDARNNLTRTTIVAPMSGRVTRLNVEQGETAIMGTLNKDAATLLTISDMSVLETKVKVDETDVAHIAIGDSAVVQVDAFPDTTFTGRVVEISNSSVRAGVGGGQGSASDQAVDYEVTIQLLDAPAETRPDFSATAKIVTEIRRQALSIPIIALAVREDSSVVSGDTAVGLGRPRPEKVVGKRDVEGVFVVTGDSRARFRPVRVGIAGEKHFEVLRGLAEGERIVAGPYQAIREMKDGVAVKPTEDPKATGESK